jgi:hypothetical protein
MNFSAEKRCKKLMALLSNSVIVDSGSIDQTLEIAALHGCRAVRIEKYRP